MLSSPPSLEIVFDSLTFREYRVRVESAREEMGNE